MLSAIPVMAVLAKIISGGQTGVDRAALDAALKHGIECGGWCPAGRLDEFGKIPERYPLKELTRDIKEGRSLDRPGGAGGLGTTVPQDSHDDIFAERTLQNVKDSDGTVIIFRGDLSGGTKQSLQFCESEKRPCRLIDAARVSARYASEMISKFVRENGIQILNVAGPRASEWAEGYEYALEVVDRFLADLPRVIPSECEGPREGPL